MWYFRPKCQGKLDYNTTVAGDMGIEITKEEFNKLIKDNPIKFHKYQKFDNGRGIGRYFRKMEEITW